MRTAIVSLSLVFVLGSVAAEARCPSAGRLTIQVEDIVPGSVTRMELGSAAISGNALVITKRIDVHSPQILRATAGMFALPTAELCVLGVNSVTQSYAFQSLFIVSVRQTASPAEETVTLNFAKMTASDGLSAPTEVILGAAVGLATTFATVFTPVLSSPARVEQVNAMSMSIDRRSTGKPLLTMTLRGIVRGFPLQDVPVVASLLSSGSGYGKGDTYSSVVISLTDASGKVQYPAVAQYILRGVTLSIVEGIVTRLTYQDFDFVALTPPTPTTAGRVSWNVKTNAAL